MKRLSSRSDSTMVTARWWNIFKSNLLALHLTGAHTVCVYGMCTEQWWKIEQFLLKYFSYEQVDAIYLAYGMQIISISWKQNYEVFFSRNGKKTWWCGIILQQSITAPKIIFEIVIIYQLFLQNLFKQLCVWMS